MANGNFLSELKRRNVYRVGAAYAVAAFVLIEIVSNVAPILDLPGWIGRAVILLLVVGFPAVLCFAWVYEITPDGVKRTAEVEQDASVTHQTGHRLNIVIIGLMVVLAGLYGAQLLLVPNDAAEQRAGSAPAAGSISIAVLPFVNLSGDPGQEFFSDGMTEEITSALAKVQSLRVVARTSAFEFKGDNKDVRAIGKALGASHLLEGSVRKSGSRVRITGQLIKADNGTHLWTENYDRELTDIFVTQDDIAKAIAGALQVPLGLKPGATLVANRTADPEIHQQYLRAKAIFRARVITNKEVPQTIEICEQVVANDPSYAPAWALLAQAYAGQPSTFLLSGDADRPRVDSSLSKAEAAGQRAIELDPQNADSYVGRALALQSRGKYVEAEDLYKHALKIDAFNPDLLHFYSQSLLFSGRIKEAVAVRQQLLMLEPLVPIFNDWTARILRKDGQYEAALALYKGLPVRRRNRLDSIVRSNVLLGRGGDAATAILDNPAGLPPDAIAAAVRLLRMPPVAVPPQDLPELPPALAAVYLYVGATERYSQVTFNSMERYIGAGYHYPGGGDLWGREYTPARKTERFKALMRKAGLVEYWRVRGWPDICRPVGADDFECS